MTVRAYVVRWLEYVIALVLYRPAILLGKRIPMRLNRDEYIAPYGRVRTGAALLVDPMTASRWRTHGIAYPAFVTGPWHPHETVPEMGYRSEPPIAFEADPWLTEPPLESDRSALHAWANKILRTGAA